MKPNTRYAVIWDMDGVIVDTADFHYQAWVKAFAPYGIAWTREQFRAGFGMNNAAILRELLGPDASDQLVRTIDIEKEDLFRSIIRGQARLLPGVLAWLQALDAAAIPQAIASSAPQVNIEFLVDELGLRPYFRALVSGYDMPGKPEPNVFLEAARRLQMPPECCIVIEDGIAGVEGARRAGMKCLAVMTTHPATALAQANLIAPDLEHIPVSALPKLLGVTFDPAESV